MAKYAPLSPPIQGMPIAGLDQREVKTLPGYQDDWDLLQENLESSGMFPFAPGLGDAASELDARSYMGRTSRTRIWRFIANDS